MSTGSLSAVILDIHLVVAVRLIQLTVNVLICGYLNVHKVFGFWQQHFCRAKYIFSICDYGIQNYFTFCIYFD